MRQEGLWLNKYRMNINKYWMNINKYCLALRSNRLCSELPNETLLETLKNRMIKALVNILRGAILQWERNGLEDKTGNF